MIALVRMRLAGFLRTGRALAPLLAGLVVLGILYGGGAARPAEAYGVSAVVLFPVLAWQTKILLDAEPDVQRRLARVAVGAGAGRWSPGCSPPPWSPRWRRSPSALVLPWLFGGVDRPGRSGRPARPAGLALGRAGRTCWPCRPRWRSARWPAGRSPAASRHGVAVLAVGAVAARSCSA